MPRIKRHKLPALLLDHLVQRREKWQLSTDDLLDFRAWLDTNPQVLDGKWHKRFRTFFVCGEGSLILTFLPAGRLPEGEEIIESAPISVTIVDALLESGDALAGLPIRPVRFEDGLPVFQGPEARACLTRRFGLPNAYPRPGERIFVYFLRTPKAHAFGLKSSSPNISATTR